MAPQSVQSLTLSRSLRAIQHNTCSNCLRAPVGVQRRGITHSWKAKVAASEKAWAVKARQINEGSREHVWDIINERGLVKDVAG
jgi:tyrosyl-tRNA synthetase